VVVPFTSSITSNLLRALQTLFGLEIQSQRFYAFMGNTTLPWKALWRVMWRQIPEAATKGRMIVALEDSINPKSGRKGFGCGHFHDLAAKGNQGSYPWSQCIPAIGLLKNVKSLWACLPLDFRFYMMKKDIDAKSINAERNADAVLNHLNFCMMATTLSWIYADRLQCAPDRIRGRSGFAFSDVRRIIAEAALDQDLYSICPLPRQRPQKFFAKTLLRNVA
jgi:hypothetical protein